VGNGICEMHERRKASRSRSGVPQGVVGKQRTGQKVQGQPEGQNEEQKRKAPWAMAGASARVAEG
jgi:hypothetical protein